MMKHTDTLPPFCLRVSFWIKPQASLVQQSVLTVVDQPYKEARQFPSR